ncbi:MAG: hydantoinase/oxoprolinase family protein [Planctomycetota bacterium]
MKLGIDTGGTFTDFLLATADGALELKKLPSTPDDPSRVIREALAAWGLQGSDLHVVHGSTVATNTLLERKGARTALVTTRGFADVIEIGRQDRPRIYDLAWQPPPPLVPRACRREVTERVACGGMILVGLPQHEIDDLRQWLRAEAIESVAVCLLFSPENDAHECVLAEQLADLGIPIVLSSRIHPEIREYERFSTTTISAYVAPVMQTYLGRLARSILPGRLEVMESSGGVLPWDRVAEQAVRTVLSGPAGGVVATTQIEDAAGSAGLVALDMGGTSTDVCLITGGEVPRTTEFRVGGLPVAIPVVNVHTVGAGGGSEAWIDGGGVLRVGPASAGAMPGPVCYGRGGNTPTVTDANVFLRRLPWDTRLGSEGVELQPERIEPSLAALALPLNLSKLAVARGIVRVVEAEMERALRRITQERGVDPRELTLVPFGGAAGLHAVALARALQLRRVLIPNDPGVLSARGMLLAPREEVAASSVLGPWTPSTAHVLREKARAHERDCRKRLGPACGATDGVVSHELRLRLVGQSYGLDVPWGLTEDPRERFFSEYARRFGAADASEPVEVTTLRTRLTISNPVNLRARVSEPTSVARSQPVFLECGDEPIRVPHLPRASLKAGDEVLGPALIEECSSTLWLPPAARAVVRRDGVLLVDPGR